MGGQGLKVGATKSLDIFRGKLDISPQVAQTPSGPWPRPAGDAMRIPIDKAEPGMEVAVDVMNVNDMLLVPKGAVLTARQIRLLKTWGVESLPVVGDEAKADGAAVEMPSEILKTAEARVNDRFVHVQMNDATRYIKSLAIKRTARRLYQESLKPLR